MLRAILAQREYTNIVNEWHRKGVPFKDHLYVPEIHPNTGVEFCEREDEGHVFKASGSYTILLTMEPLFCRELVTAYVVVVQKSYAWSTSKKLSMTLLLHSQSLHSVESESSRWRMWSVSSVMTWLCGWKRRATFMKRSIYMQFVAGEGLVMKGGCPITSEANSTKPFLTIF